MKSKHLNRSINIISVLVTSIVCQCIILGDLDDISSKMQFNIIFLPLSAYFF